MVDVAIIVSLGLAETVLNNVEVDISVVNVVNWLFEGDLGEKVKFRQAERQYKHRQQPLFNKNLTVNSFEGRYMMDLKPYKEPKHVDKPHDGCS